MRIRGAKTELEEAGLDSDGMATSTSQLRDMVKAMTGFDIMENETTFKSIYDIVVGIGKEWDKLNDVDRAALLQKLAGKAQGNALSAALENTELIEQTYGIAEGSEGSAMREQETWEKGVEAKIAKMKAMAQTVSSDMLSSDQFGGMIEGATKLLGILDQVINKLGTLGTLGVAIGAEELIRRTGPNILLNSFTKYGQAKMASQFAFGGITGGSEKEIVGKFSKLLTANSGVEGGFNSIDDVARYAVAHNITQEMTQQAIAGATIAEETGIAAAEGEALATSFATAKAEATGMGTALAGLQSIVVPLLAIATAIGAIYAASKYVESLSFGHDEKVFKTSKGESDEESKKLDEYNSKIEQIDAKIEEINSKEKLTITDEAELENLRAQREELEALAKVQETQLENAKRKEGKDALKIYNRDDATEDLTKSYTDTYAGGTYKAKTSYGKSSLVEAQENELKRLGELKEQRKEILKGIASGDYTQDDLDDKDEEIAKFTKSVGDRIETLQEWRDAMDTSTKEGLEAYTKLGEVIDSTTNTINGTTVTPLKQMTQNLDKAFKGNEKEAAKFGTSVKQYLTDVAKEGGDVANAMKELGISMEDLGLSDYEIDLDGDGNIDKTIRATDTLNDYFKNLAKSVDDANKKIENTKSAIEPTFEALKEAQESENSGQQWESITGWFKTAQELKKKGLVGTDDFKAMAQFMSPTKIDPNKTEFSADAYVKAWNDNVKKFKRYFDQENPMDSINNFIDDAISKGIMHEQEGTDIIRMDFDTTAEAAKKMGLSVEATEAILGRMKDYGFEFDDIQKSSEQLSKYKEYLDGIHKVYEEMDDGEEKEKLGKTLEGLDSDYAEYEQYMDKLNEEAVVKIKFEYDLAQLRNALKAVEDETNQGYWDLQKGTERLAAGQRVVEKLEEKTSYDESSDSTYNKAKERIKELGQMAINTEDTSLKQRYQQVQVGLEKSLELFQEASDKGYKGDYSQFVSENRDKILSEVGIIADDSKKMLTDSLDGYGLELVNQLGDAKKQLESRGLTGNEKYGNVDPANRQRIYWNDKTLEANKSALMSYEKSGTSWDSVKKKFQDTYSTIQGMSAEFDGVEIAFTPILQDGNGKGNAKLLDSNTIHQYINSLIKEAGEGWTTEDLLRLDAQGIGFKLENGQEVKNMIADIGDGARQTGEDMHYISAYADALNDVKDASVNADGGLTDYNNNIDKTGQKSKEVAGDIKDITSSITTTIPGATAIEPKIDSGKLHEELRSLSSGSGVSYNAKVQLDADTAPVDAKITAIKNEKGEIEYSTNINNVEHELQEVKNEDGTISYKPKGIDKAAQEAKEKGNVTATITYKNGKQKSIKTKDETQNVNVQTNATSAIAGIAKVSKTKIADKVVNIKAKNHASSVISNVKSALSNLHDKSITLTTNKVTNKITHTYTGPQRAHGTVSQSSMSAFATGSGRRKQVANLPLSRGFVKGNSVQQDETALINEVGKEGVVRDGKFYVYNNGYPTYADLKMGDVVFNHKQVEELEKKGYITNSHARIVGGASNFAKGSSRDDDDYDYEYDYDYYDVEEDEDDDVDGYARGTTMSAYATGGRRPGSSSSKKKKSSSKKKKSSSKKKKSSSKKKKSSSSSSKKAIDLLSDYTKQLFDWVEITMSRLNRMTERSKTLATNAQTLVESLGHTADAITYSANELDGALKAEEAYLKQSDKIRDLSKQYADKENKSKAAKIKAGKAKAVSYMTDEDEKKMQQQIRNGTFDIASYGDYRREYLEEYKKWYEKALEEEDKQLSLQNQITELYKQRLDTIESWYNDLSSQFTARSGKGGDYINLFKASGNYLSSTSGLKAISDQRAGLQNDLTNSRSAYDAYLAEFRAQVLGGNLKKGTKNYDAAITKLYNLEDAYYKANQELISFEDSLVELDFTNIENAIDILQASIDRLNDRNDFAESVGNRKDAIYTLTDVSYSEIISKNIEVINKNYEEYLKALKEQGKYEIGSEPWMEMAEKVNSARGQILDLANEIQSLGEKTRELRWKEFDNGLKKLERVSDSIEAIQDLLNEDNFLSENGFISDEGMANLLLFGELINQNNGQIENYRKALDKLQEDYDNNNISLDELNETSEDYIDKIADLAKSTNDYRQKVLDQYLDSIKKQNELLDEEISKRTDALKKQKDYYDYQKTISSKSKDINYLEQQIRALDGVSNKAAQAKLASLRQELAEANAEMADTKYQHEMELRSEGYDRLSEDVSNAFERMSDDISRNVELQDKIISDMLGKARENWDGAYSVINEIIRRNGLVFDSTTNDIINNLNKTSGALSDIGKLYGDVADKAAQFARATGLTNVDNIKTNQIESVTTGGNSPVNDVINRDTTSVGTTVSSPTYLDTESKVSNAQAQLDEQLKAQAEAAQAAQSQAVATTEPVVLTSAQKNDYLAKVTDYINKNVSKAGKKKATDYKSKINQWLFKNDSKRILKDAKFPKLRDTILNGVPGDDTDEKLTAIGFFSKAKAKKKGKVGLTYTKFAKGSYNIPRDQLAWTQEQGGELIYRRTDGAVLTPLGKGDKVFTADMTDNLWKLAQMNMDSLQNNVPAIHNNITTVNNKPNITMSFESFMTVQGNVDKDVVGDLRKFKAEIINDFTKQLTDDFGLFGHKLRF